MRNSNIFAVASALALAAAPADEIQLDGGRRVTGNIDTILPDGTVTIQAAFAKTPLTLRGDAVRAVLLGIPGKTPAGDKPTQAVILHNGDILPGEILAMDQTAVSFRSPATGDLTIPANTSAPSASASRPTAPSSRPRMPTPVGRKARHGKPATPASPPPPSAIARAPSPTRSPTGS